MSGRRRVADYGAVAKRTRAPFHTPLKPTNDFATRNRLSCRLTECRLVPDLLYSATFLFNFDGAPIDQRATA